MSFDFKDIIIPLFSLIISILALGFSFFSFRRNEKNQIQPLLVFYSDKEKPEGQEWLVHNVGYGPAINIKLAQGDINKKWANEKIFGLPALAKDEKKDLKCFKSPSSLLATYSDIRGNEYTCICNNNINIILYKNMYKNLIPNIFEWNEKIICKE